MPRQGGGKLGGELGQRARQDIGKDQIDAVRTAHPDVEIFLYEGAGHAFANPDRPSYKADSAALADERSLAFLKENLA